MQPNDIKLAILNASTFILSFTNIEAFLKIILLCVSIIYTLAKIYEIYDRKNQQKPPHS